MEHLLVVDYCGSGTTNTKFSTQAVVSGSLDGIIGGSLNLKAMSAVVAAPAYIGIQDSYSTPSHLTDFDFRTMADRRMSSANESNVTPTTLLLRKLPKNTNSDAVRTMLLFAKGLQDTEIVSNEYDEDIGFATAIARFASMAGASEAKAMLDGKPNTAGHANMIVDIVSGPALGALGRRNTIDPMASTKRTVQSVSPPLTGSQRPSRFNGAFQAIDKASPPPIGSPPEPSSEAGSHMQTIFSPQSPHSNLNQDRRMTGKLMIREEGADEETGELLKDPLAYMHNNPGPMQPRKNNQRVPTSGLAGLSLDTNITGPNPSRYASPRSAVNPYSPHPGFTPTMGHNSGFGMPPLRHQYPPVNPADQNPPCNTLYVGNLPLDTSEDELKALFSKQRGYKRLCFRTKQNGPMCFVEFEDISFATKALNELYGVQLHNSVKGGIRLSFSKNPLGVRAGQPGSNNPSTPLSATGPISLNNIGNMTPGGFSTANGPPPGLSMPPGLGSAPPVQVINAPFLGQGMGSNPGNMRGGHIPSTTSGQGNGYPDYMMGR